MSQKPPPGKDKGKKPKKVDDEKEKELMDYLKKHFFFEKFKDSVKEMIDMDPNLPRDPVKYDKAVRKKRDKLIEDFVKSEFQFFFNVAEYAKVLIDSWKGTYGNCLCGGGVKEPPIPEFLVREIRPDTPRKSLEDEEEGEEKMDNEVEQEGEEEGEEEEEEARKDLEDDELEEMLSEVGEGEDEESAWIDGASEEVSPEEAALEEEEEPEEDEKVEEEVPQSDDEPCTCLKEYMFPYPPEDYDYPFNEEAHK